MTKAKISSQLSADVAIRGDRSHFFRPDSAPVPKFLNPVQQVFKFENPTPVQAPATIMYPTQIYPCIYLRNDYTDSCCCRSSKVTPGLVYHKFLASNPDPVSSEISDLCEISELLLFLSCFASKSKRIKFGNYVFDVCRVN